MSQIPMTNPMVADCANDRDVSAKTVSEAVVTDTLFVHSFHRPQEPTFRKTDFSFFFFMSQAPAGDRRTVVGGARVISGAENKNHLIEAAPFGSLDQM